MVKKYFLDPKWLKQHLLMWIHIMNNFGSSIIFSCCIFYSGNIYTPCTVYAGRSRGVTALSYLLNNVKHFFFFSLSLFVFAQGDTLYSHYFSSLDSYNFVIFRIRLPNHKEYQHIIKGFTVIVDILFSFMHINYVYSHIQSFFHKRL